MRGVVAALAGCLMLASCAVAPAPAPAEQVRVVQHMESGDPRDTGKCLGKFVEIPLPEVPANVPDPEVFLKTYYDNYITAYCEHLTALRTLSV